MGLCGPCVRVGERFGGFHDLRLLLFRNAAGQGRSYMEPLVVSADTDDFFKILHKPLFNHCS
jgi:hypothetical protein